MSDARTTEEALAFLRRMRGWWDNSGGRHTESREWDAALDTLTSRLEALEVEHEAVAAVLTPPGRFWFTALATAHDNAERVMERD